MQPHHPAPALRCPMIQSNCSRVEQVGLKTRLTSRGRQRVEPVHYLEKELKMWTAVRHLTNQVRHSVQQTLQVERYQDCSTNREEFRWMLLAQILQVDLRLIRLTNLVCCSLQEATTLQAAHHPIRLTSPACCSIHLMLTRLLVVRFQVRRANPAYCSIRQGQTQHDLCRRVHYRHLASE